MEHEAFYIATGRSRHETHWKNEEWTWEQFAERAATTCRTEETLSEYMAASKAQQDDIKDKGGFVGGYLRGGRRAKGHVASRRLLTLDIDFASTDVWDIFCLMYDCAALVYSTHKHTPDKPRLRLVILLDRDVLPEEYEAIGRRVAQSINIEMFDDTTYQAERLMYWPSTASDAEFYFRKQDGPALCADDILSSYRNWRDTSEWPMSDRVNKKINLEVKKQANPLEKRGIVGVFCRTYNIHEAIATFLPEVYIPCDHGNRYTYALGTTSAGLIVYDDLFAYSHHGTDPASMQLCNAFDLVRIHKFGGLDDNVDREKSHNTTNYPSYIAMCKFAAEDAAVKRTLFAEKTETAQADFANVELTKDENPEWREELSCDGKGNCDKSRNNILLILRNDPNITNCFSIDCFSNRAYLLRPPMWRSKDDNDPYMRDDDVMNLRAYIETMWGIDAKAKIDDALGIVSRDNAYHPVKNYLSGLYWDGMERLDTVFIDYLGVEDTPLSRLCTRISLVACIARIMSPGCDMDYTTVLVGAQGVGKSKLLAKLAVKKSWFNDGFSIEGKEAYENLRGKWIVEIAELAGIKKADMDSVKKYLTKTSDFYRAAFERYPQDQLRQCVFFGTTNNLNFLRDVTGDRRFWPLEVHTENITKNQWTDLTEYEVGQIWAEAIHYYNEGQPLYLPKEMEAEMNNRRDIYTEVDDRIGMIQQYLDTRLPANWAKMDLYQRRNYLSGDETAPEGVIIRSKVCIAEICCECLGMPKKDVTRFTSNEIMGLMRKIDGWEWSGGNTYRMPIYGRSKCFLRKPTMNTNSSLDVHQLDEMDTSQKIDGDTVFS